MCNGPEAAQSLSRLRIKGKQVWLRSRSVGKDTGEVKGTGASLDRTWKATGKRVNFPRRLWEVTVGCKQCVIIRGTFLKDPSLGGHPW